MESVQSDFVDALWEGQEVTNFLERTAERTPDWKVAFSIASLQSDFVVPLERVEEAVKWSRAQLAVVSVRLNGEGGERIDAAVSNRIVRVI